MHQQADCLKSTKVPCCGVSTRPTSSEVPKTCNSPGAVAAVTSGGAPALAVAGGALATSFLGAGLAAGDGAVMKRLMELLAAPLSSWEALVYGSYAEAVGVRARVALLLAHAQCCIIGVAGADAVEGSSSSGGSKRPAPGGKGSTKGGMNTLGTFGWQRLVSNELCSSIVWSAHEQYHELLLGLWWAVLQDASVVLGQGPVVQDSYRSALFGDSWLSMVEEVGPCYAAAWPVVLGALAARLPAAKVILALPPGGNLGVGMEGWRRGTEGGANEGLGEWLQQVVARAKVGGASVLKGEFTTGMQQRLKAMHAFVVDFCLWGLSDAAGELAMAAAGAGDGGGGEVSPGRAGGEGGGIAGGAAGGGSSNSALATAAAATAAQRLCACLLALEHAVEGEVVSQGLVAPEVLVEVLEKAVALVGEVLLPLQWSKLAAAASFGGDVAVQAAAAAATAASGEAGGAISAPAAAAAWDCVGPVLGAVACLLKGVVGGIPADMYDRCQGLLEVVLELGLAITSAAVPYKMVESSSSQAAAEVPSVNGSSSSSKRGSASNRHTGRKYAPAAAGNLWTSPVIGIAGASSSTVAGGGSNSSAPGGGGAAVLDVIAAAEVVLKKVSPVQLPGVVQQLSELGLRLLLTIQVGPAPPPAAAAAAALSTAAKGGSSSEGVSSSQQLTASQRLLESCWAAGEAVAAGGSGRSSSSSGSSGGHGVAGVAARVAVALHDAAMGIMQQTSGSSRSSATGQTGEEVTRLSYILSAEFNTAAAVLAWGYEQASSSGSHSSPSAAVAAAGASVLQLVQEVITTGLQASTAPSCSIKCCEALRGLLQDAVAVAQQQQKQQQPWGQRKLLLARQCLPLVGQQVRRGCRTCPCHSSSGFVC